MKIADRAGRRSWFWGISFVLAVMVGGLIYYLHEAGNIRDRKYREIAVVSELKAGQIRQWRLERLADAGVITKSPFFRKAVMEWLRNPAAQDMKTDLQARLELVEEELIYEEVLLCDPNGRILFSTRAEIGHSFPPERDLLEKACTGGKARIGECFCGPNGKVYLDTAAPVLDPEGRPAAVVILRSRLDDFLYPLIRSWPIPSPTAESLVVRRQADTVLFLNDLRCRPAAALGLAFPLTRTDIPAAQAVLGRQGLFEGKDYRGREVLADLRPIPGSPWFMVAKVDTREILAEARYRGWVVLLSVVFFTVFSGLMIISVQRRRRAALYQNLFQMERKRNEALELFRTTLYSIGDGVIATDKEGVVTQMNQVAEKLTGWPESEARGRPINEIFQIVNEKTRTEVENPVQRVLYDGIVVNLANHTLLIARDGSERPIADSGAPIRDDEGAIVGVVLVFRDQTQERSAEEILRKVVAQSRRWSEEVSALLEGAKVVLRHTDFTIAARRIFDICRALISAEAGYIALLSENGENDEVLFLESGGLPCGIDLDLPMPIRGLREKAYGLKQTIYENDFPHSHWMAFPSQGHVRLDNVLFAPLLIDECAVGVMGVANKPGGFNGDDVRRVSAFAELASVSLRNSRTLSALTANEKKLQKAHDELEKRVQERTLALTQANEQLLREIEERLHAEEKIVKSKKMLQTVFDGISEPLIMLGIDMTIRILNLSACEYYQISQPNAAVGEPCFGIHNHKKTTCPDCLIHRTVCGNETAVFERRSCIDPERLEQVTVFPIAGDSAEEKGAIVRITDITETHKMQKALLRSEKLASIGVLSSGIAHEINNPNNFITFNIPVLKQYLETILPIVREYTAGRAGFELFGMPFAEFEKDCFELVRNIENGADRIKTTVAELKEFSVLRADEKRVMVSPRQAILQAMNLARVELKHTVKRFVVEVPEELPEVLIDVKALEQVIVNLLINAAQAADKEDSWIRLKAAAIGDERCEIIIEVQDNGCGIDERVIGKIFDPFYTTKPVGKGTGLGLYICHNLMEGMEGRIDVSSRVGEGTVFTVRLKAEGHQAF